MIETVHHYKGFKIEKNVDVYTEKVYYDAEFVYSDQEGCNLDHRWHMSLPNRTIYHRDKLRCVKQAIDEFLKQEEKR